MGTVLNNFDTKSDFWEVNPQLVVVSEFAAIKAKYKKESSNIMWALALVYDYDSKFFNIPENERVELICKDYLGDPSFFSSNKVDILPAIRAYDKLQEDSERRYLRIWSDKVEEITKVLKDTPVDVDNIENITKMLLLQEKLMEQKDKIEERLQKKEAKSRLRGGATASLLESGEL